MIRNLIATFFTLILFFPGLVLGDSRDALIASIDDRYEANKDIALSIWELAELGYLEVTGTIRVYGTPAEEGGSGKVYMVREGLFDDVDAVLSWHPGAATLTRIWERVEAAARGAAAGTGTKGMQLAAKTLALTAADFFEQPELAEKAHAELISNMCPCLETAPRPSIIVSNS